MDAVDRALRRSERRRAVLDIINITGATSARALKAKPALSPYPAIESVHEVATLVQFHETAIYVSFGGIQIACSAQE